MTDSSSMTTNQGSLYEQFGVASAVSQQELKRAYRKLAFSYHPDRNAGNSSKMQQLNRAWFVLSDPDRRFKYDQSLRRTDTSDAPQKPRPPTGVHRSAKAKWFESLRRQSTRLGLESAKSATRALATRHKCPKETYADLAESIVRGLGSDIKSKSQLARKAGSAPLDLALVVALVGIKQHCEKLLRACTAREVSQRDIREAQLLDRMWDNLAHGISRDIEMQLGGNPRVLKALTGRRV